MTNEDPDSYSASDVTLLDLMGHQTLQEESGSWGAVTLCCVHQNCRIVCTYRDLAAYIWNRAWCYYWAGLKNIMRGKGEFTHLVLFPKNDTRGARDCLPLWHLAGTQCNHHLSASLKQVISSSRWNSVQCTQQAESRDKRRSGEDLHELTGETPCLRSHFSHCFSFKICCPGASKNIWVLLWASL